ncbi:MAG: DNA translocase FtsK 4TM domain-containing protein [Alphaproteobacteria bacterium]
MIGSSFQDQPGVFRRLGHASLLFARDRLMEVIGLGLILAGVAMTLALSTFSPLDPSFNNATPEQPWNLLGRPGSYFADIVMQTVGLGAIAFVPPIAVAGWWFMAKQGPGDYATRLLCWMVSGLCASALAASLPIQAPAPLETSMGGWIGDAIYQNLIGAATWLGITDPRSLRLFAGILAAVFALVTFAVAVGVRVTDYRWQMRGRRRAERARMAATETAAAADPVDLSWWQRWAAALAGLFGAMPWARREPVDEPPRPALEHAGTHYPDRDPVFEDTYLGSGAEDHALRAAEHPNVPERGGWQSARRPLHPKASGHPQSTAPGEPEPAFDLVATPWTGHGDTEPETSDPIEAEAIDPPAPDRYADRYHRREPSVDAVRDRFAAERPSYDYAPIDVAPESYEPAFDRSDASDWAAEDDDAALHVRGMPDGAPEQPTFAGTGRYRSHGPDTEQTADHGRGAPFPATLDGSDDDGNWDDDDVWTDDAEGLVSDGHAPRPHGAAQPPSPPPMAANRTHRDEPYGEETSASEPPWAEMDRVESPYGEEPEDRDVLMDEDDGPDPADIDGGDLSDRGVSIADPLMDPPMPPRTFAAIRTLKATERGPEASRSERRVAPASDTAAMDIQSAGTPQAGDRDSDRDRDQERADPIPEPRLSREQTREAAAPSRAAPAPTAAPTPPPRTIFSPRPRTRGERDGPAGRPGDILDLESSSYGLPPLDLLQEPRDRAASDPEFDLYLEDNARQLETVLQDFGVRGEIINIHPGPVVTLYELEPAPGIKSSRVIGLADDIARSMSAVSARVAVIPGRNAIGIELPNKKRELVFLRELLASPNYEKTSSRLALALGKQISGDAVIVDLANMPHLLIAGTTGSGKSVAINTMILSLLYRMPPSQCKLILIDPKMLELSVYEGIPHLLTPVVTDPKKAIVALKWVVREMEDRYKKMSKLGVRNIKGFNERIAEAAERDEVLTRSVQTGFDKETGEPIFEEEVLPLEAMPFIVVVVDEMADLMMVAGKDIETAVQRLAQMARAAGIHLITATQRPSVDVITGTIKANFPTRISFQVTSKIDSRTILGEQGAEQLLGQGDMLYMAGGGRIRRVHGPFVSDAEVEDVVGYLKDQGQPAYVDAILEETEDGETESFFDLISGNSGEDTGDDLFDRAVAIVARDRKASTSYIQRKLQIGYNRAARLIERMEEEGMISPANHVGKREVLLPEHEEQDD